MFYKVVEQAQRWQNVPLSCNLHLLALSDVNFHTAVLGCSSFSGLHFQMVPPMTAATASAIVNLCKLKVNVPLQLVVRFDCRSRKHQHKFPNSPSTSSTTQFLACAQILTIASSRDDVSLVFTCETTTAWGCDEDGAEGPRGSNVTQLRDPGGKGSLWFPSVT